MSIQEIKVPVLPESVTGGTVLSWYKQPGDKIAEGEKLVDIETDKVVLEVVAPRSGTLTEILKITGTQVVGEEILGRINTDSSNVSIPQTVESRTATVVPLTTSDTIPPKTSPAVRKMAADQGISPTTVPHSGDRVTKADLVKQIQETTPPSVPVETVPPVQITPVAEPDITPVVNEPTPPLVSAPKSVPLGNRPEQRVPMTRLRKRIAERLLNAQHEHAILTTFNEINMKSVVDLRNKYKEIFEKKHGVKLGFMSFFTRAVVAALQKFPIINASSEGDDIIYHGYYDIGIAVSSPRGLVVPILRDVDRLSFAEIEKKINDFGERARNAQLTIEELTGGTFSITNGGIFGSMMSTPILNPPQSAILGMHNTVDRPIAENGHVIIQPIMYVALSYDHRLIDGRDAVQFLVAIKQAIEDPLRLLLEI